MGREEVDCSAEERFIKAVEARVREMMRAAMALRGKGVEEVAEGVGVSGEWLRRVLEGEEEIPVWLMGAMAHVLDFSIDFKLRAGGELTAPTRIYFEFD